jgi:pimeloyl-ACP methyl ester carboxylesterase
VKSFSVEAKRDQNIRKAEKAGLWSKPEIQQWVISKSQADLAMLKNINLDVQPWGSFLNQTQTPTLFVLPQDVPLGGPELRQVELESVFAAHNPLVELAEIPEVGHCIRRDNPAAYFAVVDPFLQRYAAGIDKI